MGSKPNCETNPRRMRRGPHAAGLASMLALACGIAWPGVARAQDAGTPTAPAATPPAVQDIVVTAQKRSQSINQVPMSITAATGDQLQALGIKDTSDLVKVAASLTFAKSESGTPVYTLRGIGYDSNSLATRQAVSLYLDEAPIPFALESRGAQLDLARVEVLKGPQGTLFGNNATGGAIDFIANKPTDTLRFGGAATVGNFGAADISGYVSGPITDTLSVRFAGEHQGGGDWQKSISRNDKTGGTNFINGRLSLLWKPTTRLTASLTVSRWVDNSKSQQPQAIGIFGASGPFFPSTGLAGYPFEQRSDRYADWNPGDDRDNDNRFLNVNARIDDRVTDQVTLTSLTTYIHFDQDVYVNADGVPTHYLDEHELGTSRSFAQEFRATGTFDRLNLLLGVNYQRDLTHETPQINPSQSATSFTFQALTGSPLSTIIEDGRQLFRNYAGFFNAEYKLTDRLTLQGGARYTQADVTFDGCSRDGGDGITATAFTNFIDLLRGGAGLPPIGAIPPGGCYSIDPATLTPGLLHSTLDQHNVSWRAGVQYKLGGAMLYANVSKGYKGGSYPRLASTFQTGLLPAVQESALAYEAGFKAALFNHAVQFNGAVFYTDYRNKQINGDIVDPVIGPVNKLVNIPKSRIYGVEADIVASPFRGLTLNLNGSYLRAQVLDHFTNVDPNGTTYDFDKSDLPNTPHVQLNGGARYEWALNGSLDAFASTNVSYQSRAYSTLGDLQQFTVDPRALVDASIGIDGGGGKWRAFVWGRNILNKTYWTGSYRTLDVQTHFMGLPATYGLTVSADF